MRRHLPAFFLGVVALAIAGGAITSKLYWGYFFTRPATDPRILGAARFLSVTEFDSTLRTSDAPRSFGPVEALWPQPRTFDPVRVSEDPYYFGQYDVLAEAARRGPLAQLPDNPAKLPEVLAALRREAVLVSPAPGYEGSDYLLGVLVEAEAPTGERWLYVAMHGGQVSNDHYPVYRLLFEDTAAGLRLRSRSLYFYDVAGVEGLEWWMLACWYVLVSGPVLFAALALISALRRGRSRPAAA